MSEVSEAIQTKCLAFSNRIIKLNDFLLEQAANKMYDGRGKMYDGKGAKPSADMSGARPPEPLGVLTMV